MLREVIVKVHLIGLDPTIDIILKVYYNYLDVFSKTTVVKLALLRGLEHAIVTTSDLL